MNQKFLKNWRFLWPLQAVIMLIVALLSTFLPLLFPTAAGVLRFLFLWILPAAAGAWTACLLSRSGLISYAAWILPPVIHSLVPLILLGYLPSPFSMLLCAFVSLVGAATGDVMLRRASCSK